MNIVVITALFAASLALILGIALGIFRKIFHVEEDVLVSAIRGTLPGANCGACGFPGCDGFAAAVANREADPSKCTVSGAEETKQRAALLGVEAVTKPVVAVVGCRGTAAVAALKGNYSGLQTCRGAKIAVGGVKLCAWGCIGFGDCIRACKFGAIRFGENGLPVVDAAKCAGCRACILECPQGILRAVPKGVRGSFAFCNNRNTIRPMVKKTCAVGCIKCEICVKKCPAGALTMKGGIPDTDYGKCTACGACVSVCPQKVMRLYG
jgi:Na+-translocating ferredoxin:NAD+ oxidoreductase RNF subunit RnfB